MPKKTVDDGLKKRFLMVFMESGLTQEEFGRRIGQKQNAISQVLSGPREPSKGMLQAVITKLDISPQWLYFGTGSGRKSGEECEYISRDVFWEQIGMLKGQIAVLTQGIGGLGDSKPSPPRPA